MKVPAGYEGLAAVFEEALAQAAQGKGRDRHGPLAPRISDIPSGGPSYLRGTPRGKIKAGVPPDGNKVPFEYQPMIAITNMVGVGFPLGQAQKKAQEASRFVASGDVDRARAEILGAINYLAGALIALKVPSRGPGYLRGTRRGGHPRRENKGGGTPKWGYKGPM